MRTKHLLVISAVFATAYNPDAPWWFRIGALVGAFLPLLPVGDRIDRALERTQVQP